MIAFTRVDHRLLHGQIIYSWLNNLDCNAILIANNAVADDQRRQQVLNLSAPAGKKLLMRSLEQSASILTNPKNEAVKFFVIVETLQDAKWLADHVPAIRTINIGSVQKRDHSEQLNLSVYLTAEDKTLLQSLAERGVELEARQLANDQKINLATRLQEA